MVSLEKNAEEVSQTLKLLSHPKRLLILCRLLSGPKYVGELEQGCNISQSQLSQFLIKMRDEGLLKSEKNGQHVSYEISNPRILRLMHQIQETLCSS